VPSAFTIQISEIEQQQSRESVIALMPFFAHLTLTPKNKYRKIAEKSYFQETLTNYQSSKFDLKSNYKCV
jgi:dimeric dUTPase (all-alpha-NTP-PPase superfamily)